jgi:hypothetical protein
VRCQRSICKSEADGVDRGSDPKRVALVFFRAAPLLEHGKEGLQFSAAAKCCSNNLARQLDIHIR